MELNSEIVAAWFSYDRIDDVAVKFGITENEVIALWKQARRAGLLPAKMRRPRNENPMPARPRKEVKPTLTDGTDGRPTVENPFDPDPLLTALRREHGNDTINRDVVVPKGKYYVWNRTF